MSTLLILRIALILMIESTASNCQSLLLKLPQEIQVCIYGAVCGGNLLHFYFTPDSYNCRRKLCYVMCLSNITEDEAQASFCASTSPWFDEVCANRHEQCSPQKLLYSKSNSIPWWRLTLDLRFLRTCRHIYNAAKDLCYRTNIFSFDSLEVFMKFGTRMSWVSHIRNLRLRIQSGNSSSGPAFPETLKEIFGRFTGVKWIHIELEQIFFRGSRTYDKRVEEGSRLTQQLLSFGGKALKVAAVVISDARFCDYNDLERTQIAQDDARSRRRRRWTMREKQEYAHFLHNALLEQRGKGTEGDTDDLRLFRVWSGTVYA